MAHDPNVYTSPDIFNPGRFIGPTPEMDPRTYTFGFGRRTCPGRLFADQMLFLACATLLATLDISCAVDADGQKIVPPLDFVTGTVV
jgi:cytochrome P450